MSSERWSGSTFPFTHHPLSSLSSGHSTHLTARSVSSGGKGMRNDMTDRRRDRIRGERPEVTDDEPGHQSFSSFGLVTLMLPSFHSRRRPGPATGRPGRYAVTRRGKGRNVRRTGP